MIEYSSLRSWVMRCGAVGVMEVLSPGQNHYIMVQMLPNPNSAQLRCRLQ